MIKDEFALYIEMLAVDTTKLKWIWTKLYKTRIDFIDQMLNLIDQRRNYFKQTLGSDFRDEIKLNDIWNILTKNVLTWTNWENLYQWRNE